MLCETHSSCLWCFITMISAFIVFPLSCYHCPCLLIDFSKTCLETNLLALNFWVWPQLFSWHTASDCFHTFIKGDFLPLTYSSVLSAKAFSCSAKQFCFLAFSLKFCFCFIISLYTIDMIPLSTQREHKEASLKVWDSKVSGCVISAGNPEVTSGLRVLVDIAQTARPRHATCTRAVIVGRVRSHVCISVCLSLFPIYIYIYITLSVVNILIVFSKA